MSNRDYPNMSYCMFENTSLAMQQLIVAIEDDDLAFEDLRKSEQDALRHLVLQCEKFLEYTRILEEESDA